MDNNLIYMPTFRVRQQEMLVLRTFDFGNRMYPLLEIVKEYDRQRKSDSQKSFEEIHVELITNIGAQKVFVDLPVYLKQSGSVKNEVIEFILKVINNLNVRCEYLNKLSGLNGKIIPVISSYLLVTGESGTIEKQFNLLKNSYKQIAYRLFPSSFQDDFREVRTIIRENDYLIIDLDQIPPYPSPPVRPIIHLIRELTGNCKVLLRSAINNDIQNVNLDHGKVVMEADNSQVEVAQMSAMGVTATGDYVGIKKDDLTAGGTISPGFIYYDAEENQFYGYKATIKALSEFENRIVPDVLNSGATKRMLAATPPFVGPSNRGYETLVKIDKGEESGKSQAKFKRISMEHYLYCMKVKINSGRLHQTNV